MKNSTFLNKMAITQAKNPFCFGMDGSATKYNQDR